MSANKEPDPWVAMSATRARYGGVDFYGPHAADMAELAYLRDWRRWALEELRIADRRALGDPPPGR